MRLIWKQVEARNIWEGYFSPEAVVPIARYWTAGQRAGYSVKLPGPEGEAKHHFTNEGLDAARSQAEALATRLLLLAYPKRAKELA